MCLKYSKINFRFQFLEKDKKKMIRDTRVLDSARNGPERHSGSCY